MSCTKIVALFIATLAGWTECASTIQAAIVVDGNLSDWGISLNRQKHLVYDAGYGYSYNPNQNIEKRGQTTFNGYAIAYDLEESNDSWDHTHKVGPLYGGQDYDAEALVVTIVGKDIYIGIATGQRPNNGSAYFAPGDVYIADGTNVWGIEAGGGSHAAASKIVDGDKGTSYKLNSQGYTAASTKLSGQKAGSIWAGGTWDAGASGSGDVKTQLNTGGKNGGTYLGMSDYVYNFDSAFGQHAFIELCIPNYATLLGSDLAGATIRWSPVCGNDQLSLSVVLSSGQGPRPGPVPEPTSVMIWAVVFLAAARFARKKLSPFGQL